MEAADIPKSYEFELITPLTDVGAYIAGGIIVGIGTLGIGFLVFGILGIVKGVEKLGGWSRETVV